MNKVNKSIILLATAVSFHAPTSFANAEQFYIKSNAGYSRMLDLKIEDDDQSMKFKSKSGSRTFGIGVGYYPINKFRVDLVSKLLPPSRMGNKIKTLEMKVWEG